MLLCGRGSIEGAAVGDRDQALGGLGCLSGLGFTDSSLWTVFTRSLHVNGSSHASQ